jgi:hypothetical protein
MSTSSMSFLTIANQPTRLKDEDVERKLVVEMLHRLAHEVGALQLAHSAKALRSVSTVFSSRVYGAKGPSAVIALRSALAA